MRPTAPNIQLHAVSCVNLWFIGKHSEAMGEISILKQPCYANFVWKKLTNFKTLVILHLVSLKQHKSWLVGVILMTSLAAYTDRWWVLPTPISLWPISASLAVVKRVSYSRNPWFHALDKASVYNNAHSATQKVNLCWEWRLETFKHAFTRKISCVSGLTKGNEDR